jgi:uncharacterized membrane protein YuzA (DUF378 family)
MSSAIFDLIGQLLGSPQPTGTETCLLDLDTLTQLLVVIGALNWGSIAICCSDAGDLVKALAQCIDRNNASQIECFIKGLVGAAGVY